MPDFFNKLRHISEDIIVEISVLAPLLLADHSSFYEHSPVLSYLLTVLGMNHLLVFLFVFQVGVELVNPLLIHFQ